MVSLNVDQKLSELLTGLLKDAMQGKGTAASFAVSIDGEIVARGCAGTQGGLAKKKLTPECTFNIASISKIFVTVAVMQLCEQGKLDLDTPVVNYLPRFKMPDERYREITLRHCLAHSSGLPGTVFRNFSVTDLDNTSDYYELVYEYMSKNVIKAKPGEYSTYCNDGFTIAEMCVAAVSGMSYAEYIKNYITEPWGIHSTRSGFVRNTDYPLVATDNYPQELLPAAGAYGLTSNMTDLAAFGNLFLTDNDIISAESKAEMAKKQGATWLGKDQRNELFGLGWDTVNFERSHPGYDLGEGVLMKSGVSWQMNSFLIVIPKYNVSLTISATQDGPLAMNEPKTMLMMLAIVMQQRGINITKEYKPVPEEFKALEGLWLPACGLRKLSFEGFYAFLRRPANKDEWLSAMEPFAWTGEKFVNPAGIELSFEEHGGENYALMADHGPAAPFAVKARPRKKISKAWKNRMGKLYIPVRFDPTDLVVFDSMQSMRFVEIKGYKGLMAATFAENPSAYLTGDMCHRVFEEIDENTGCTFVRTPGGSRDWITPVCEKKNGVEYAYVNSYLYRLAEDLPAYDGQKFPRRGKGDGLYEIVKPLDVQPKVSKGRRIIIYNKQGIIVWDSLYPALTTFKPVKDGYLLMV